MRKAKPKIPSEKDEMVAVAAYLNAIGLAWLHVPNEGKRSYRTAAVLRRMGMSKGAPDILIFSRAPLAPAYRGIAIELKRSDGGEGLSTSQEEWLQRLNHHGWRAVQISGATAAIDFLQSLGFGRTKGIT